MEICCILIWILFFGDTPTSNNVPFKAMSAFHSLLIVQSYLNQLDNIYWHVLGFKLYTHRWFVSWKYNAWRDPIWDVIGWWCIAKVEGIETRCSKHLILIIDWSYMMTKVTLFENKYWKNKLPWFPIKTMQNDFNYIWM